MKLVIKTEHDRNRLRQIVEHLSIDLAQSVEIKEYKETRRTTQNSKLWAMLSDVSRQVNWHGNKLSADEWKDVFTAAQKRQKVVQGIDGGFVVIGAHTSKMKISEMAELIELMYSFGAEHNVRWSDPADICNADFYK